MKLHLPQSLRKALIACMAAFSGVVSTVSTGTVLVGSACLLAWNQAQAEVITLGNDKDPQLTSAVAGDKLIIDFTGTLEYEWNGTKTVNADVQIIRLYLSGSDAGCTYIFNGVITGDGPFQTLGGMYCDDVRFTFNNDMSGYSGNIVINESNNCILTFNLKSGATTGTGSITALNAGSVVNINGAHVANSSINAATINITKDSTFASGMSLSATKAINNSAVITLDGITLGHSIHNTGSITFSGKTTLQGIAGENKTPTTNGFVSTVYQFVTGTGTVAKADGASFMLGTEDVTQYYANGAVAVPTGTIYAIVEADSTVSSSSVANETGYIITGNNATLVLNDLNDIAALPHGIEVDTGAGNGATVQLGEKGTGVYVELNDTDIKRTTGTVNVSVQEYCTLNLTQTTNARVINGNITVAAGGAVYATAQDVLGYGGGQTQNIYLLGEPDSTAKLYFADRATLQTNLVMQGNALVGSTATTGVGVPGSVDTYGGAISATGTNNKFEADILERKAFAVEVTNAADTLDISGRISRSGNATSTELGGITKTGLGTLTLSHADNSFFGTFAIEEGKVVLAGNAEFAKNIRVAKDASLVVKDGVLLSFSSVDNLSMQGGESYVDIHGNVAENGYRSGLFAVVEAEAGVAISGITQVEVEGVLKNVTTDAATGSLLIADTDNSIYHINTTVDYDADSMGAINAYSVAPGATFNTTSGDLLYKVTLEDATSNLYYTNAAGDKLLQFSGEQGDTGLALSVADAKNADGLWVVTTSTPENNAYTGHITVLTGAVLQNGPNNDGLGKNYRDNKDRLITVQGGAALNLAGKEFYYHLVLEKGATLYNTGEDLAGNVCSLPVIDLLGDATVRADAVFGMVGYYYAETDLNLNGHTLTKTGADTFHLLNVVANAGTINVQEGTFAWLTNNVNTNNLEAVKIQLGNGATLKHNAGEKSIASLYINTTQGSASGGTVEVVNSSLTVSGSVIADELLTKTGGGTLKLNGLTILEKGVTVTGGTLELNNTVTLNGGVITVGGGTLSVGTSGCVKLGFLGGLDNTPAEVPTENKLVATEGTYKVLDKAATATVTNFSTVRYAGQDYALDATGSVSLGRNVYYAVEKDSVVTVGGTTPTTDTDKATEFYVADGATLQVDGDASEDMPVKQVLLSSAGDGLLKLNADATLSDGDALSFTGTLAVQSGKTLTFGTGGDNTKRFDIDTSSLKRMELNGGTTRIYYTALNLAELKVTGENSKWFVDDINEGSPASVINKLTLDKNLNIETNWKSDLYIGTLTGSGHLTIKQTNDQERLMSPLVIGGFEQYTGKITVSSEEN
ncbi:MAG: hypothetical protein E7033_05860, partial [Akkermansiaceae bacterium]|nr:hypothetical protein [Akkermansiaceae bacterium]